MKFVKSTDQEFKEAKGYFKKIVFTPEDLKSPGNQVQDMKYLSGGSAGDHYHKIQTEVICSLEGKAELTVNGEKFIMEPGDFLIIGPNEVHSVENVDQTDWHFLTFKINFPQEPDTYWLEEK